METTKGSLIESIEALSNESFSGVSGTRNVVYLDPENKKVSLFSCVGSGIPEYVYNKRGVKVCDVPTTAIPSSVVREIMGASSVLEELIDSYNGSEFKNGNFVGSWGEDLGDLIDQLEAKQFQFASYWDAAEWLSPVRDDVKRLWEEGQTVEQVCQSQGGDDVDGMPNPDELKELVASWFAEWEEEAE